MNIAIIGAGNVGGTLGKRWSGNGHRVVFGSREPKSEKARNLAAEAGPNAKVASNAEAAGASEIVLVATPFPAARQALREAGSLAGKIVIDATNPLLPTLEGLSVGSTDSAARAGGQMGNWREGGQGPQYSRI